MFMQNCSLCGFRVKMPIIKPIDNNIFECILFWVFNFFYYIYVIAV